MKVCQYFMTRGKKILIILNHKRKTEELKIFAEVSKKNLLIYYAPSGVNDDLVWLYASLRIEGKKSSEIYVVTNDKMTDHIYYTFPEYFKTWMERHQVNFDFDKKTKRLTIIEPTIYSNRIQTVEGKWYFPVEGTRKWLYF